MRLRILDDEFPGYARLAFDDSDGVLTEPTLALSVRSPRDRAFLGTDGRWQNEPMFFTATRLEGDGSRVLYRVGPDIVNHMREQDSVEFATPNGSLKVETIWENAVPQVGGPRNAGSIYQAPRPGSEGAGSFVRRVENKQVANDVAANENRTEARPVEEVIEPVKPPEPPPEIEISVESPKIEEAAKPPMIEAAAEEQTIRIAAPKEETAPPPPLAPPVVEETSAPPPVNVDVPEADIAPPPPPEIERAPEFDLREEFGRSGFAKYVVVALLVFGAIDLLYGVADTTTFTARRGVAIIFLVLFFVPGIVTLGMGLVALQRHRAANWILVVCAALCFIGILFDLGMVVWFLDVVGGRSNDRRVWEVYILAIYAITIAAHGPGLVYFYRMSAAASLPFSLRNASRPPRPVEDSPKVPESTGN